MLSAGEASLKFQLQLAILPVEMVDSSVKVVVFPKHSVVALKSATGIGFTVTTRVMESLQPSLVATSNSTV